MSIITRLVFWPLALLAWPFGFIAGSIACGFRGGMTSADELTMSQEQVFRLRLLRGL
jgi:hypothetical protein